MKEKRIVVTGRGLCLPFGLEYQECLDAVFAGGIGEIPDDRAYLVDKEALVTKTSLKSAFKVDHVTRMVLNVVSQCLKSSQIDVAKDPASVGILSGSLFGSFLTNTQSIMELAQYGPKSTDPEIFPLTSHNYPISLAAIEYGLKGPITSFIKSMNAGTQALSYGVQLIKEDLARQIIVLAYDEITNINYAILDDKMKLSRSTNTTKLWSPESSGSFLAEGCGGLVLEDYDTALARRAEILGEIIYCGNYFISPTEKRQERMKKNLQKVRNTYGDHDWNHAAFFLNASCIPEEDMMEKGVVDQLSLKNIYGLKPLIGNYLGGAGIIEPLFALEFLTSSAFREIVSGVTPFSSPNPELMNTALVSNFDFLGHHSLCLIGK